MEAHVKTVHGTFKVDGETPKDLFKAIAGVQEVFSEKACGLCGNTDIRMVVRPNKNGDEFYEYQCLDVEACGAYLAVSASKTRKGQLFPNRKLEPNGKPADRRPGKNSGKFGPTRGWTKYRGEYSHEEE